MVAALVVPFFSYLEARDETRAAERKATRTQQETSKVDKQTNTAFQIITFELRRLAKDVDACHAEYADLRKIVDTKGHHRFRHIRRPPPQIALSKSYRDVKSPPDASSKP